MGSKGGQKLSTSKQKSKFVVGIDILPYTFIENLHHFLISVSTEFLMRTTLTSFCVHYRNLATNEQIDNTGWVIITRSECIMPLLRDLDFDIVIQIRENYLATANRTSPPQ